MVLGDTILDRLEGANLISISENPAIAEPPERVDAALRTAVPAVLGHLTREAHYPEQAMAEARIANRFAPDFFDTLPSMLRSSHLETLAHDGMKSLHSLLGDNRVNDLILRVVHGSGVSMLAAQMIAGLTASITFAALEQHVGVGEGAALARYLSQQAASMPQAAARGGRSTITEESPYDEGTAATASDLDMEGEAAISRQELVPGAHGERYSPSDEQEVYHEEPAPTSAYVSAVIVLLAAAFAVGWLVWPRHADHGSALTESPLPPSMTTPPALSEPLAQPAGSLLTPDAAGMATAMVSQMGHLHETPTATGLALSLDGVLANLSSIRDSASANAALPRLRQISQELDLVPQGMAAMPAESQEKLREIVRRSSVAIRSAANNVRAVPGSEQALTVVDDDILPKLTRLSASTR